MPRFKATFEITFDASGFPSAKSWLLFIKSKLQQETDDSIHVTDLEIIPDRKLQEVISIAIRK